MKVATAGRAFPSTKDTSRLALPETTELHVGASLPKVGAQKLRVVGRSRAKITRDGEETEVIATVARDALRVRCELQVQRKVFAFPIQGIVARPCTRSESLFLC